MDSKYLGTKDILFSIINKGEAETANYAIAMYLLEHYGDIKNINILDMAEYLSETGKPVWIRHVLVPERSDKDEYLHRLHDFIETLDNVEKVEVLPYHTLGVYKWKELGIPYQLEGIDPPSQERVENANLILETAKYHA